MLAAVSFSSASDSSSSSEKTCFPWPPSSSESKTDDPESEPRKSSPSVAGASSSSSDRSALSRSNSSSSSSSESSSRPGMIVFITGLDLPLVLTGLASFAAGFFPFVCFAAGTAVFLPAGLATAFFPVLRRLLPGASTGASTGRPALRFNLAKCSSDRASGGPCFLAMRRPAPIVSELGETVEGRSFGDRVSPWARCCKIPSNVSSTLQDGPPRRTFFFVNLRRRRGPIRSGKLRINGRVGC